MSPPTRNFEFLDFTTATIADLLLLLDERVLTSVELVTL